jgi:hypothetical protein
MKAFFLLAASSLLGTAAAPALAAPGDGAPRPHGHRFLLTV